MAVPPVSMDLFALATLPPAADEAGGPPFHQVLRATGQPHGVLEVRFVSGGQVGQNWHEHIIV